MKEPFDIFVDNLERVSNDLSFTTSIRDRSVDLALSVLLKMQRHNLLDSLMGCDTFEQYCEQFKNDMTDCIELDHAIWLLLSASVMARDCFFATKETGRC